MSDYEAELHWTEGSGELTGELVVRIPIPDVLHNVLWGTYALSAPIAEPAATLEAQLDALLNSAEWDRVGDISSWPSSPATGGSTAYRGRCHVRKREAYPNVESTRMVWRVRHMQHVKALEGCPFCAEVEAELSR